MKLTNKYNLPEPFVLAVKGGTYDNGGSWRSVTELIGPPKIAHLKRKHDEELEEDVIDRVYTLQGEIAHGVVERAAKQMGKEGWLSEQRIFKEVQGKKISGAYDLFDPTTGTLIDVKNSTAWKAKKNEAPKEWVEQTNLLAHLIRGQGHKVNSIKILLIIRDHSKPEARRDPEYPQAPVVLLEVPIWDEPKCQAYLEERVRLHLDAEVNEATCSPEDRWAKPTIWAIKKKGQSRAMPGGLFADEQKAKEKLAELGTGYEIEHRPGENTRCELYCPVAKFCAQYKKMFTQGSK
jgi:hypothetical protein